MGQYIMYYCCPGERTKATTANCNPTIYSWYTTREDWPLGRQRGSTGVSRCLPDSGCLSINFIAVFASHQNCQIMRIQRFLNYAVITSEEDYFYLLQVNISHTSRILIFVVLCYLCLKIWHFRISIKYKIKSVTPILNSYFKT